MSAHYAYGYSDPRIVFGVMDDKVFKYYGGDYKEMSYTQALAASIRAIKEKAISDAFSVVYDVWKKRYRNEMKTDAHKYETEAKDLDIEVIHDLWQVKYGNGKITTEELANQDPFTWECGNRLWWAGYLSCSSAPELSNEYYTLLDEPNHANHRQQSTNI